MCTAPVLLVANSFSSPPRDLCIYICIYFSHKHTTFFIYLIWSLFASFLSFFFRSHLLFIFCMVVCLCVCVLAHFLLCDHCIWLHIIFIVSLPTSSQRVGFTLKILSCIRLLWRPYWMNARLKWQPNTKWRYQQQQQQHQRKLTTYLCEDGLNMHIDFNTPPYCISNQFVCLAESKGL